AVISAIQVITAIGVYMQYWFPNTPRWLWALLALLLMSICKPILHIDTNSGYFSHTGYNP
ncbi:hypothetical protein ACT4UM_20515, partial [Bacillus sp. SS-TM]